MTRWTRFRMWLWWKTCPRMTIIVRCGRTVRGHFYTSKQFTFHARPELVLIFDCHYKFPQDYEVSFGDQTLSKAEILGAIDSVTSAETIEETEKRFREETIEEQVERIHREDGGG